MVGIGKAGRRGDPIGAGGGKQGFERRDKEAEKHNVREQDQLRQREDPERDGEQSRVFGLS